MAQNKRKERIEKQRSLAWLTHAQVALGWGVILALAALLGTIYLFQASRTAQTGRKVQIIQNRLDEVKRVNAELERDIAESQSLERLEEELSRLGFVRARPEDIEYLVIPDYPQEVNLTPAPSPTPLPKPVETMGEAVWLTFRASVGDLIRGESP